MAKAKDEKQMVTIKLFKDNGEYKEPVFVSVNGENYLIQRGIEVQVPLYVAQVIENSVMQEACTAALIEKTTYVEAP